MEGDNENYLVTTWSWERCHNLKNISFRRLIYQKITWNATKWWKDQFYIILQFGIQMDLKPKKKPEKSTGLQKPQNGVEPKQELLQRTEENLALT